MRKQTNMQIFDGLIGNIFKWSFMVSNLEKRRPMGKNLQKLQFF